jgi:uncharacterized membrane protein required for colicin V production
MLFAELSSDGELIVKIAGLVFGFLTTVATGVIGVYMIKARDQVKDVEKALQKTNSDTQSELADIKNTGEATYHLSNSAMQEAKRLLAVTARALATSDPSPANLAAALVAEEAYDKHKAKQNAIDGSGK